MNPNSAYKSIDIVVGTDYTPTEQFTTHNDPNIGATSPPGPTVSAGLDSPIYAMLCTASNTGPCEIQLLGDSASIIYPAGTFKQGVVYYMYLKKLVSAGGSAFVGFKYHSYPFVL